MEANKAQSRGQNNGGNGPKGKAAAKAAAAAERPASAPALGADGKSLPAYVLKRQAKKAEEAAKKAAAERKSREAWMEKNMSQAQQGAAVGGRGLGIQEPEPEPEPEPSPSPSPSPGPSPRPGYSKVGKSGNGKDKKKKRDKGAGITQANAFSLLGPESSDSGDSDSDFESVNGDASSDGGRDTNDNDSNAKDHSEELKFKVPMRELGLLRGYGDQNIKRAEERHGVYSIQVESNGQVVMRGESLGCLEAAKQALQIVEDTLNVPKQQFDAYVRRFRTDSAKARRIDEIWKETSARVSWEKDSRKSRKSPNPAMCQFSIMGPQVALDIALAALQEELEEAVQQQPPQPPPPKQMQELPNRNGRAPAGKTTKQESEQAESGADAPVEPKRGPPAETTSPSKESALPPLPEGLWEKIRLPCDERWETVLVSENLSSDSDEVEVNTLVPPVVVARIARRVFPTLRNTDAVSMAYRTVPSDAAGMIQVADLKQLVHNLVFINNHWPAVYALKRNAGYDMDLITFRGSWQSFCLSPTRTEGAKETGTDTADEIDSVFAQLMDERFRKTVEAKQQIKEAAAEADEEEEESDLPPTERPTRASFDEFISALAMHYADDEEADGGFAADLEEKLALCRELKTAGNESYKGENWAEAIEHYTRALDAIKACEAEAKETDLAAVLLSNRAAARGLADRCMDALSDCERCVELAPTYMRGVKRRADCHAALGVWDKSIADFQTVVDFCSAPASSSDGTDGAAATGGEGVGEPAAAAAAVDEQTAKLLEQAEAGLKSVEKVRRQRLPVAAALLCARSALIANSRM